MVCEVHKSLYRLRHELRSRFFRGVGTKRRTVRSTGGSAARARRRPPLPPLAPHAELAIVDGARSTARPPGPLDALAIGVWSRRSTGCPDDGARGELVELEPLGAPVPLPVEGAQHEQREVLVAGRVPRERVRLHTMERVEVVPVVQTRLVVHITRRLDVVEPKLRAARAWPARPAHPLRR